MSALANGIEFEVRHTQRDLFRALLGLQFRKLWFLLFIPVAALGELLLRAGDAQYPLAPGDVVRLLAIIAGFALFMVGLPYWSAKKSLSAPNFTGSIRYRASESGIDIIAPGSQVHHDWRVVDKVQETKRHFLLYCPKNCLAPIPKSSLDGRVEAFRDALREKIPDRVRLSK